MYMTITHLGLSMYCHGRGPYAYVALRCVERETTKQTDMRPETGPREP